MARRTVVKRKNYTKTKAQKDIEREAIKQWLGDEISDNDLPKLATNPVMYSKALNWYRQVVDIKEARLFLESFLQKINNKHYDAICQVPDVWINSTACWIARLLSRGAKLPDSSIPFFKKALADMVAKSGAKTDKDYESEQPIEQRPSIQANIRSKAGDLIFELEKMIDEGKAKNGFDAYKWLSDHQVSSAVASKIVAKFEPILAELLEAKQGEDKDLLEGYQHLSTKQLNLMVQFYQALIDDTNKVVVANKPVKIRKARPRKPEQVVSKMKPMKVCEEFGITSIDPKKILGAQELWVFNTTWKMLTVFRAASPGGLDVNRTAIVGWDPRVSVAKRIGRNTADDLQYVLKGSKAQLRRMMDDIKMKKSTPNKINFRIADNIVLLRVF